MADGEFGALRLVIALALGRWRGDLIPCSLFSCGEIVWNAVSIIAGGSYLAGFDAAGHGGGRGSRVEGVDDDRR